MTYEDGITPDAAPAVIYFGVGAQKAGTSWLFEYLAGHPEVSNGPLKEYHYFSHFHRRLKTGEGRPRFFRLRQRLALASVLRRVDPELGHVRAFRAASGGTAQFMSLIRGTDEATRACGDITPVYSLLDRTAFSHMLSCGADVRFFFIMRDPVARLWSQVRMRARRKDVTIDMKQADVARMVAALSSDREYLGRSDYARTITELEAVVPAERIHYMFYEDMFTPKALAALTRFLGISDHPADFGKVVHQGVAADMPDVWRHEARLRLDPVYRFIKKKFSGRVPASWDQGPRREEALTSKDATGTRNSVQRVDKPEQNETKPTRHQRRAAFEMAEV